MIERRLRRAERSPADAGKIFRHEINNPLTGILGNAEWVLGIATDCRRSIHSDCRPWLISLLAFAKP